MNERNPEIDPMLYPLLFPYSEAGIKKYKVIILMKIIII